MERVFTKDIGRFKEGDSRNYPMPVWESIAKSAKQALTDITLTMDEIKTAAMKKEELEDVEQTKGNTKRGTPARSAKK